MANIRHGLSREMRQRMTDLGIDEVELAKRCGISAQYLRNHVLSTGDITLVTLERLAKALGVKAVVRLERKGE